MFVAGTPGVWEQPAGKQVIQKERNSWAAGNKSQKKHNTTMNFQAYLYASLKSVLINSVLIMVFPVHKPKHLVV